MKLPKTVFVSIGGNGNDEYLHADTSAAAHVDNQGDTVRVGKYELVEYADVTLLPQIVPVRARKPRS